MSASARYKLADLPLPSKTLQGTLEQIPLPADSPTQQRRSRTFGRAGVWARVTPLPLAFPYSYEVLAGRPPDPNTQADADALFGAFDDNDEGGLKEEAQSSQLALRSSSRRREAFDPILLGVSSSCLSETLPHLDIDQRRLEQFLTCSDPDRALPNDLQDLVDVCAGRKVLMSSDYGPWSTRYAGHQFGQWAGQLGDGRAISILETRLPDGRRQEIQLKGSGRTPFSRSADGLATYKSGVREYLCSEAMSALGVPTSRALAVLTQNDLLVTREHAREQSSIVARLAPSFLRVGHFECLNPPEGATGMTFVMLGGSSSSAGGGGGGAQGESNAPQRDLERLRSLADWVQGSEVLNLSTEKGSPYVRAIIREIASRNARMVAAWQAYGFCHGVINTDNVSLLGLTVDYGPWAFIEAFDPWFVPSQMDGEGRYDYRKQPTMVLFAIRSLARSLAELTGFEEMTGQCAEVGWSVDVPQDKINEWKERGEAWLPELEREFMSVFKAEYDRLFAARLGLKNTPDTVSIRDDLLTLLQSHDLDFHASFRALCNFGPRKDGEPDSNTAERVAREIADTCRMQSRRSEAASAVEQWLQTRYKPAIIAATSASDAGVRTEAMRRVNPRFVLRRWVVEEVLDGMLAAKDPSEARKALYEILEMATHPFDAYGEAQGESSLTAPDTTADQAAQQLARSKRWCQVRKPETGRPVNEQNTYR